MDGWTAARDKEPKTVTETVLTNEPNHHQVVGYIVSQSGRWYGDQFLIRLLIRGNRDPQNDLRLIDLI